MDSDNLPMLRNISDSTESTPQVAMHEGTGRSSEYSERAAIPSLQVAMLQDVRKDISDLTSIVKQFVEYNINRDKSLDTSFTMVGQDEPTICSSTSGKRKRSDEVMSVSQTHDSFEHNYVSHSQHYSEAVSSAKKLDVVSSKRSKSEHGIDSLFHSKHVSECTDMSKVPLNMEDELLDYVENELPDISTDKKGPSLLSRKLATNVENLWQNPSSKMVGKIFKKYSHPANLENVMVPPMPKPIMKMGAFRDFVASREKKFYNVQQSVVKSSHIMSSIADDLIQAEQSDQSVDVKSLVVKALDSISILANSSTTLSNMRKANIKNILNKDVQGLCDPSRHVSMHLFGDEFDKRIKEEREAKRLAQVAVARPQLDVSRRNMYGNQSYHQTHASYGRGQRSFLERGQKSRFYRRNPKPSRK